MGLFNFKKKKTADIHAQIEPKDEYEEFIEFARSINDVDMENYYSALADKDHQNNMKKFYALCDKIKERYTVISNVCSFSDPSVDMLIADCLEAFELNVKIQEKAKQYKQAVSVHSFELKTLAMIYEKQQEYEQAAMFCIMAIENGFTSDGTTGGMRGRLARMIKKGNLELTDQLRKILEI